MTLLMDANMGLVGINVILLGLVIVAYARILREVRTGFTWGLLAFAMVLWVQNAIQLYFFATMMPLYAGDVEAIVLVQNLLGTVAAGFLLVVTWAPNGSPAKTAPELG